MPRYLRPILLMTALMAARALHGQYFNLSFRNYSSPEGLANSEVKCAFQDSSGLMWVGTTFGLSRFDGQKFTNFFHDRKDQNSIGQDQVVDIRQVRRGRLWIAFDNLFGELDPFTSRYRNHSLERLNPGNQPLRLNCMVVDASEHVWLGTSQGLARYDPAGDSLTRVPGLDWSDGPSSVLSLAIDRAGRIWAGTQGHGLWMLPSGTGALQQVADAGSTGAINGICLSADDTGWLACEKGLFRLQEDVGNPHHLSLQRQDVPSVREPLRSVLVDHNQNIWMATRANGLYIYFPKTGFLDRLKEDFSSTRGLLSNHIYSLAEDRWGGIWIASEEGIQSFHDRVQLFNVYPGISSRSSELRALIIFGLVELDNVLVVATSGALVAYDRMTNHFLPIDIPRDIRGIPVRFRTVQQEAAGRWWISSDHGFFELVRKGKGFDLHRLAIQRAFPQLGNWSFRNYLKGAKGDYWFSTMDSGLVHCEPARHRWERYQHAEYDSNGLSGNDIMVIRYDREGRILVCTDYGLSILDTATRRFSHVRELEGPAQGGLSHRNVYDVFDDGRHYWIGTYGGGLNMMDKRTGKLTLYRNAGEKSRDAIDLIVPQADSVLWIGTNNGLARFSIRTQQFRNFTTDDGLPENEFNTYANFQNSHGEIFMSTIGGLFSFHPDSLKGSPISPVVQLTRLRLNGSRLEDSVVSQVKRDLAYAMNWGSDLYLEFSPMTFTVNMNYRLQYQVASEALDTTWRNGEVGYLLPLTRLDPGEHRVSVRFVDADGSNSPVWRMSLIVMPPFWMTWWFRMLLITAGLILLYAGVKWYTTRSLERQRREFERQQIIEKERSRISAELHDDIGGGLTAIRLMSEMAMESDRDASLRTIHGKISHAANDIVQKMNEIVWALNLNHDDLPSLVAYTRQFAISYMDDMGIKAIFLVPERIPAMRVSGVNRRNIFLLVKESLNNVVKHADATDVAVEFDLDRNLRISVRDNGKGLPEHPGKGNGFANMQKRVNSMGGHMEIRGDHGTTIMFTIPMDRLDA